MGVIFTAKCALCDEILPAAGSRAMLCPACAAKLHEYRCVSPVHVRDADDAAAPLLYRSAVQHAMKQLKFHGRQSNALWFAAQATPLLAERLESWKPDLITYAPIGFWHYYKRGYNQARLIAQPIADAFGLPCRPTLRKRLFARKQSTRKTAEARWKNAEKAFRPGRDVDLTGQSVVFIDDIITTGATASKCVRLLRELGAAHVYVLAPTRTPK